MRGLAVGAGGWGLYEGAVSISQGQYATGALQILGGAATIYGGMKLTFCFVAGTQVVIGIHGSAPPPPDIAASLGPVQGWNTVCLVLGGMTLLQAYVNHRKRRRKRIMENRGPQTYVPRFFSEPQDDPLLPDLEELVQARLADHSQVSREDVWSAALDVDWTEPLDADDPSSDVPLYASAIGTSAASIALLDTPRTRRQPRARSTSPMWQPTPRLREPIDANPRRRRWWTAAPLLIAALLFWRGLPSLSYWKSHPIAAVAAKSKIAAPGQQQYETANIEDLKANDIVLAADPETGELRYKRIVQVFERIADHLQIVTLVSANSLEQMIQTTDEHPFFIVGHGFVKAMYLRSGQQTRCRRIADRPLVDLRVTS